jgi:hypothetical protein
MCLQVLPGRIGLMMLNGIPISSFILDLFCPLLLLRFTSAACSSVIFANPLFSPFELGLLMIGPPTCFQDLPAVMSLTVRRLRPNSLASEGDRSPDAYLSL